MTDLGAARLHADEVVRLGEIAMATPDREFHREAVRRLTGHAAALRVLLAGATDDARADADAADDSWRNAALVAHRHARHHHRAECECRCCRTDGLGPCGVGRPCATCRDGEAETEAVHEEA